MENLEKVSKFYFVAFVHFIIKITVKLIVFCGKRVQCKCMVVPMALLIPGMMNSLMGISLKLLLIS